MKRFIAAIGLFVAGALPLQAGEMDREAKAPAGKPAKAVVAPATPGTEMDAESPEQSWCRFRGCGWGWGGRGCGWGGGWGYSSFYRPWGGGWGGGWGCGPRVSFYYGGGWGGGWYGGGCW